MRGLIKRQIDWLYKAINDKNDSTNMEILSIQDDAAIATDGKRIHAISGNELSNRVDGADIEAVFSVFDNAEVETRFAVNPKFLADACAGFSEQVNIILVRDKDFRGVIINSDYSDNEAYIMCMLKGVVKVEGDKDG
jgi:hypothetical protein